MLRVLALTNLDGMPSGIRAYRVALEGQWPDGRTPRVILQQLTNTWWLTDEGTTLQGMPSVSSVLAEGLAEELGVLVAGGVIVRQTSKDGWKDDARHFVRACSKFWSVAAACRPPAEEVSR